jgi:hypothetical protein
MPTKVLPTAEDFNHFQQEIGRLGFQPITQPQFADFFKRLGLHAPRKREGREVGFTFSANGLTVTVWTTFLVDKDYARDEDSGWVLISENGVPKYFTHPMLRTSGFMAKLLMHAKIARERVLARPICPNEYCFEPMEIAQGRGLKSRYWRCKNTVHKGTVEMFPWDYGLCDESVCFLRQERRRRARYRKEARQEGKKPGSAMLSRRTW